MYFIIIHSSDFYDLLSSNIMFDKETKQGMFIVIYNCELNLILLIKGLFKS